MYPRILALAGTLGLVLPAIAAAADGKISYDRQIRPILSKNCFQCHGPDDEARKAKLRLDTTENVFADREGHAVIVPGKADQSELLKRITHTDPDERMPAKGDALPPEHVALLRQWINEGASYAAHWSFETPQRPVVPGVSNSAWTRNPIDNFVLQRLESEGLAPSPEADRETLARRLSLDLTGLPPSLDDMKQIAADGENWYAAYVDRLLASPHYGERWARAWLDAAQYADSDGFEKDKPRQVYAWRDWVIGAFNDNMPYDRFVVEQIAGDMLPNATQDDRVATGFLRNSMINEEGGIDPEQFRMEAQFNRMDIIGRAVLGLTIQCAQCHTHKYDPLTHTDYYRTLSFLNNAHESCITVYSPEEENQREAIAALIDEIERGIKEANTDWPERMAKWEAEAKAIPNPKWETVALNFDASSDGGQKFIPQEDGSFLAQGYAPTQFQPKATATVNLARITAIRLELLPDPNLPRGGPGRSVYGTSALSNFEMRVGPETLPIADFSKWSEVKIASAIADINPPQAPLGPEYPDGDKKNRVTGPIEMAIDDKAETAWTTDIDPERRNEAHTAIFTLAEPLTVEFGMMLAFRLGQQHGGENSDDNQNNNLGRFRISVTGDATLPDKVLPPQIQAILGLAPDKRSEADQRALFSHWRSTLPEFAMANNRIDALRRALPQGATQLVLAERDTPRLTHRLERGDFLSPAESVEPGVPSFLHALDVKGNPSRLDFAQWTVSKASPTTARAFVNRAWQQYFGTGIVPTSSDLGTQGDAPSHPELLDWLAVEFMDSDWDIKALQRLIVSSATYRQSSKSTPEMLERDPYNTLVARGARYRVDGETVRDVALAASGLLNPAVGGPSVYPPAPDYLFQPPASYGPKTWTTAQGNAKYRRALYTFRFRSVPYPALQTFDTPPGDAPCTRRSRSNSPLQALTTLNEPLFFECAKQLADRTLAEGGATTRSRIEYAFRRCVNRPPEDSEVAALEQFLAKQRERIAGGELTPASIVTAADTQHDAAEWAAWTLTARIILNLDETITRQ